MRFEGKGERLTGASGYKDVRDAAMKHKTICRVASK